MNLFIVESPFQLLSAVEASKYFKGSEPLFIIKYNKKQNNIIQLKKIKKLYDLNNVIEVKSIFLNFDSNIQLFFLLKKFISKKMNFEKIFIGEYRSFHMRKFFDAFFKANSFCLDDGSISYQISNYIEEEKDEYYFDSGVKGLFKEILYKLQAAILNLNKLKIKREIKLFTCFDIPNKNKHIIHNFSNIKQKYNVSDLENVVYFYGSHLEIAGISEEKQIIFLEIVSAYFKKLNLEIIYLPHRLESNNKLELIKNKLHFRIIKNEFPAEIQLLVDGYIPKCIASFASSVLITLPKIFPEISNVYAFLPNSSNITKKYLLEWEIMKDNYKKTMKVIDL